MVSARLTWDRFAQFVAILWTGSICAKKLTAGRSRCRCVRLPPGVARQKWPLTIDVEPEVTQKSPAPCAAQSSQPPASSSPSRESRYNEIDPRLLGNLVNFAQRVICRFTFRLRRLM